MKFSQENPIEKEKLLIDRIEKLTTTDASRVDLILAWKGYKPATDFLIGKVNSLIKEEELEKAEREALKLFDSLGLSYAKRKIPTKSSIGHFVEYLVTKEKNKIEEYREIWENLWEDNADHESFGRMMGFPETAINAYVLDKGFFSDFPEEFRQADYMAFLGTLSLSKDNWKDEIEIVKKWAEQIKCTDPALYDREVLKYHTERSDAEK